MTDPFEVLRRVVEMRGIHVPPDVLKQDAWDVKCRAISAQMDKKSLVDEMCVVATRWESAYGKTEPRVRPFR